MDQRDRAGAVAFGWAIFGVIMLGVLAAVCTGHDDRPAQPDPTHTAVFRSWDASTGTGGRWERLSGAEVAAMEADRASRRSGLNADYGRPVPGAALVAYGVEARDWSQCRILRGDTSWVTCPDGLVIGS